MFNRVTFDSRLVWGFLTICILLPGAFVIGEESNGAIRMPGEWEAHERTYMVWPQSKKVWKKLLPSVRMDIARIANAIIKYEPVVMLAAEDQIKSAEMELDPKITIIPMAVDDLWARDTLPVFVTKKTGNSVNPEKIVGVDFNFNGWGGKQIHSNDAQVARKVLELYSLERVVASIVGEGGSFETDGQGTLLVTESSVVNDNRNKGQSRDDIEKELKRVLGVKKVIWFDGVYDKDITDAHIDSLMRFVIPGVVVLNRPHPGEPADIWSKSSDQALKKLKNSTDANGNSFKIIEMFEPDPTKIVINGNMKEFLSSYVNFYVGNGFVIVPKFGDDKADRAAQNILEQQFPGRQIVPVQISTLASGGGGIHCATHDLPVLGVNSETQAGKHCKNERRNQKLF